MKEVYLISGARPNIIKAYSVYDALKKRGAKPYFIYLTQHYTKNLSEDIFDSLRFYPDETIYVKPCIDKLMWFSTALLKFNTFLKKTKIKECVVFGDVDTSMLTTMAIKKYSPKIKLYHVEAGLRCFESKMQEELNRIIIDHLSDVLFASEPNAIENLKKEGLSKKTIYTGNVMIDTLKHFVKVQDTPKRNGIIITIHRKENLNIQNLGSIFSALMDSMDAYQQTTFAFILHPHTCRYINENPVLKKKFEKIKKRINFKTMEALPYVDFVKRISMSEAVITDSGGLQEETTYLNVPCITLRTSTERPVTITHGTNVILPPNEAKFTKKLRGLIYDILNRKWKKTKKIDGWDGKASHRIAKFITEW
ncbi:MAG: UDP-N-acetylglucosamine 2-epimerase [Candidatus Bilamarchaeaceae archaeon]